MEPQHTIASKMRRGHTNWLWRDRIPYGHVTLLAANPGVGKSSLGSDLAARVTRGQKFPGCDLPVPKGRAIIFCAEENTDGAPRYRANEQGADLSRCARSEDAFNIADAEKYLTSLVREAYT